MKAEDLFDGGWYKYMGDTETRMPDRKQPIRLKITDSFDFHWYDDHGNRFIYGGNIKAWMTKPIPLTPEILRDWFGFENGAFKVSALTLEVYVKPLQVEIKAKVINGEMKVAASINVGEFTKMFPIKYVHQLQRLYHALTGEPLKRVDL